MMGAEASGEAYCWTVSATIDGQTTQTTIDFLQWNDLVKKSLSKSIAASYVLMLRTLWIYLSTGVFWAAARVRPAILIAMLYPFGLYLAQPLAGAVAGLGLAWVLSLMVPLGLTMWVALSIAGIALALKLAAPYNERYFTTYLILAYAYIASNRGGPPPGLFARGERFVERVAQALDSDVDEVLIVGHSAGAGIGISLCAMLLRAGRVPRG